MDWAKLLSHSKKWYLPAGRDGAVHSIAERGARIAQHAPLRLRSLHVQAHVWLSLAATSSCLQL